VDVGPGVHPAGWVRRAGWTSRSSGRTARARSGCAASMPTRRSL
jgi:hypothetical protein